MNQKPLRRVSHVGVAAAVFLFGLGLSLGSNSAHAVLFAKGNA